MANSQSLKPWQGILTATATPFRKDLSIDFDKYAEHVQWLASFDHLGVIPNGSLGEYQVLTRDERSEMVKCAVAAAPKGFQVVPGVAAYGATEARDWAEQAAAAGASAVMLLPPTGYRANDDEVIAHYKEVAKVGIPIIAYNNPFDTKVDLTPSLVGRIATEVPEVVAIKEFSGDVRRVWQIHSLAPRIEIMVGADDVLLELATGGISGWIAGFTNALPRESKLVYDLAKAGEFAKAKPLYAALHDLFHWDSQKEFIQAIKATMDFEGRYGGPTRLPRLPLPKSDQEKLHKQYLRFKETFKA
ncbi:MAG: dihydrodipicolinate synthase family protein [Actinomycetales bacterium]|jgi:dihydrodipicolinate synthase/N-acetylneuraminate lyase